MSALLLLFLVVDFVLCEIVGPPFFHTHGLCNAAQTCGNFFFFSLLLLFFLRLCFFFVLKSDNSLETITLRMVLMDSAIGTIFIVSSFCPQSYPPPTKVAVGEIGGQPLSAYKMQTCYFHSLVHCEPLAVRMLRRVHEDVSRGPRMASHRSSVSNAPRLKIPNVVAPK